MSETYFVAVRGCDDVTKVLLNLTVEEIATVVKLRDAVNRASESGCMPTMETRTATQWDEDDLSVGGAE